MTYDINQTLKSRCEIKDIPEQSGIFTRKIIEDIDMAYGALTIENWIFGERLGEIAEGKCNMECQIKLCSRKIEHI